MMTVISTIRRNAIHKAAHNAMHNATQTHEVEVGALAAVHIDDIIRVSGAHTEGIGRRGHREPDPYIMGVVSSVAESHVAITPLLFASGIFMHYPTDAQDAQAGRGPCIFAETRKLIVGECNAVKSSRRGNTCWDAPHRTVTSAVDAMRAFKKSTVVYNAPHPTAARRGRKRTFVHSVLTKTIDSKRARVGGIAFDARVLPANISDKRLCNTLFVGELNALMTATYRKNSSFLVLDGEALRTSRALHKHAHVPALNIHIANNAVADTLKRNAARDSLRVRVYDMLLSRFMRTTKHIFAGTWFDYTTTYDGNVDHCTTGTRRTDGVVERTMSPSDDISYYFANELARAHGVFAVTVSTRDSRGNHHGFHSTRDYVLASVRSAARDAGYKFAPTQVHEYGTMLFVCGEVLRTRKWRCD